MADWTKIQIEYEQGVKPKELGAKYKLTAKQISDKANRNNWKKPSENRTKKVEKSRKKYEEKIESLFCVSLIELEKIINAEETRNNDKINAIKCVIDISGFKKESQEVKNLTPQIVVAQQQHKITLEKLRNADLN